MIKKDSKNKQNMKEFVSNALAWVVALSIIVFTILLNLLLNKYIWAGVILLLIYKYFIV
jgi:hypothetical protein